MKERKAFNFYKSYYEIAKELPQEDRLSFFMAILEKQFDGIDPDYKEMTPLAKFAYISQKHSIDKQCIGFESIQKRVTVVVPSQAPTEGTNEGLTEEPSVQVQEKGEEQVKVEGKRISTIEERKLKFASTLEPFLSIYGREMLNNFFKYWTEPNKSKTKFRQELERTWDTERRLGTWASREKKSTNNQKGKIEQLNELYNEFQFNNNPAE
jgi:hypothetical protein